MGKRGSAPKAALKASAAAQSETLQAYEPIKLNLYDCGALRSALDDCAREVVVCAGYDEDVSISNVKIVLGLTAMGIALYAQFGPGKFPDTWWTVLACLIVYIILTVILQLFSWRHEGDAFLLTHPRKGHSQGIRLSSSLERYGDLYTLKISSRLHPSQDTDCSSTWSIAGLFHEDGYLAEALFRDHVLRLLEQWETQQLGGSKKDN